MIKHNFTSGMMFDTCSCNVGIFKYLGRKETDWNFNFMANKGTDWNSMHVQLQKSPPPP